MNKMSLDEKVRRAKATPFSLPKEVSLKKRFYQMGYGLMFFGIPN